MNQIEDLLDEPVSLKKKMKARTLNKEGITLFESGSIDEAVQIFEKALEATPKHPALNLNLVQVLLKVVKTDPSLTSSIAAKCRTCLDNVKHIPERHRQYKRYQHLIKKVAELE